ncbi:unnamed protein product [Nezara viridula]|uniref:Uncharacterized protein n=1 Tax=Nezara viridula TaxID=85310 RepID=A0A9P0MSR0_NEZVI|nr:unnamed protein product [Nezara viridula]
MPGETPSRWVGLQPGWVSHLPQRFAKPQPRISKQQAATSHHSTNRKGWVDNRHVNSALDKTGPVYGKQGETSVVQIYFEKIN